MVYVTRRTSMLSCNGDSSELVGFAENGESGFVQPLSTLTHSSPRASTTTSTCINVFLCLANHSRKIRNDNCRVRAEAAHLQHLRYCEACIRVGSCNYDLHLNILTSLRHPLKGWRNQSGRSNLL